MRLLVASLAAMALLVPPASAQFSSAGGTKAASDVEMQEKQRQRVRDEIDRKYLDAVKRTRQSSGADASNDPWAGIRSSTPSRSPR